MSLEWRVPVQMREPVRVAGDRIKAETDIRSRIYENVTLGEVINMTDLAGTTGKLVRIISIFAYIANNPGVATTSWINYNHVAGSGILGQAFLNLEFPVPANGSAMMMHFIGATTVRTESSNDFYYWHCALPDILMDDQFEIEFRPNGGTGRYYILYEVFDK